MIPLLLAQSDEMPKFWFSPAIWPVVLCIVAFALYSNYAKSVLEQVPTSFKFLWAIPLAIALVLAGLEYGRMTDPIRRTVWGGGRKGKLMLLVGIALPIVAGGLVIFYDKKVLPKKLEQVD